MLVFSIGLQSKLLLKKAEVPISAQIILTQLVSYFLMHVTNYVPFHLNESLMKVRKTIFGQIYYKPPSRDLQLIDLDSFFKTFNKI